MPGGRITALLQPRVLGYVFNPISIFWCHDRAGVLHKVIVEVHNTYGQRHAYLLPPASTPVRVSKKLYVSPFNPVSGHYQVRAPRPDEKVDVVISLHGEGQSAFVATLRGTRRPATVRHVARMQIVAPLAPLMVALRIRIQGIALWLRRVPVVPPDDGCQRNTQCNNRSGTLARGGQGAIRSRCGGVGHSSPTGCCAASPAAAIVASLAELHGTVIGAGNAAAPMLKINRPDQLARRIGRHGLIGFGESYMAGEWESDALTPALTTLATEMDSLVPRSLQWLRPVVVALPTAFVTAQPAAGPARHRRTL